MMKRAIAALLIALALPASASAAVRIEMAKTQAGENTLTTFEAKADEQPPALMAINMQIAVRFEQEKAQQAALRAGAQIEQQGMLYQDGTIASMARIWRGEQADGRDGCSAAALTVNLETGAEIYLDELFSDYEGALGAMEAIIADDVLETMSDYMEYAELLPMPQNCYSVDEWGLTVYWPEESYRYFTGESGSVTFYWHELAPYIGKESPVYALAHPDDMRVIEDDCKNGNLGGMLAFDLGEVLGNVERLYALADPDYTTDALVFPLERVRGYAVEIPKYAQTKAEMTPVSAVRSSRISVGGLTTGQTTKEEILALMGSPVRETAFDEDAAFDAMLEPGESLYYEVSGRVLEAHVDESGVLSCLILRSAMPESLY